MSMSTGTRPTRSRLFTSTALAALVALPGVVRADNLPTGGIVASGTITAIAGGAAGATGGGPTSALSADPSAAVTALNLQVANGTTAAVVNWTDFQVGAGRTLTFAHQTPATNFSVLNRVNGGGLPTAITGLIDGGGTGRIWVINEAGIAFGGTIQNTRGLVMSTLAVTDAAFANFETTGTQFSGAGSAGITVLGGATTPGNTGPLVLVAPAIDTAGTLTAAGDAALVVAADATVQLSAGSNIAVTIAAGTPVATANSLNISGGSINADQIYAVGLTSTNIAAALLNVAGSLVAGNASATASGIVLSAGRSGSNVTVTGAAQPLDVVISVAPTVSAGPATEVLATRDITATSAASATFRSLDAGRNANVSATTALTVTGTVTAVGDYIAAAESVTLGTTGQTFLQSAGAGVTVTAAAGDLVLNGALTLQSGTAPVALASTLGAITGAGANIVAGPAGARQDVGLVASGPIELNDVTGNQFSGGTLAALGDVTFNDVSMTNALRITSSAGNVQLNDTLSDADTIDVRTTLGTITARGATATVGDVLFAAAGALTVSGDVSAGASYTAVGSGVTLGIALEMHSQNAATDIIVRSTATGITGLGTLSLTSAANGGGVGSITLDSAQTITGLTTNLAGGILGARTDVRILSVGTVELQDIAAATLGTTTRLTDGPPPTYDVTTAYTAGGNSTFRDVSTVNTLDLASAGDLTVAGATSLTGGVDLHPTNLLTTTGLVESAAGFDVLLRGANNNIGGAVTSGRDLVIAGGLVNLGTAATTVLQQARGSVLVSATQIAGAGTLTLRANSDDTANPVGEAIVLDAPLFGINAPTTNLIGGTVAGSIADVGVRGGATGVVLGDVAARTFGDGIITTAVPVPSVFTVDADVNAAGPLTFGTVTTESNLVIDSSLGNIGLTRAASNGSVTLTAAAGALNLATANAAVGDLQLSGSLGVTVTGLATGAANASATSAAGNVDISGTLNATTGSVTATATLGNATLANATAGTDVTVSATAATRIATLGNVTAARDVTATGAGITATAGTTVQAGDDIDLDASSGAGPVNAAGTLLATGIGPDSEAGVGALGAANIRVRGTGAVTVASATTQGANGRDVLVSSSLGSATLNGLSASRDVILSAATGATIGTGSAGRDATVSGGGVTQTGTLTAGDDIVIRSTASVSAGTLTATGLGSDSEGGNDATTTLGANTLALSNVRVFAQGAAADATVAQINAARDATVDSSFGNATLGIVTAGRDVTVTALGPLGSASVGSGTVGRNLSVRGTLGATIGGTLDVGQDILLEAAALTVGTAGATTTLSADGELTLRATGAAGLTAQGNAVVIANADGVGGGALNLDSAGGIFGLNPATGFAAGFDARGGTPAQRTDVRIRLANLNDPVTLGDVTGSGLGLTSYIGGNPLNGYTPLGAAPSLIINGAITLGSVTVSQSSLDVRSLAGALTVAGATTTAANGAITLIGQTALTVPGDIVAPGIVSASANAGPAVLAGNISGRDITATGAGLTLGSAGLTRTVIAQRDLVVSSTAATDIVARGALTLRADAGALGGSLQLDSAGSILGAPALVNPLGDVRINLAGAANPARTIVLGDVSARAFGSGLGGLGVPPELNSPGAITLGTVAINGTALRVVSGGALNIVGGSTTGAFDIRLTGNTVNQTGSLNSGQDIIVSSTAGSSLATAIAARDLTVGGGGNLSLTSGQAGDDIVLRPAGTVTAGSLTVTGAGAGLDSEAGSDAVLTLGLNGLAGSNIVVVADGAGGSVTLTSATATGGNARDVTLLATTGVSLSGAAAAARDLRIDANVDGNASGAALLGAGTLTGGRDLSVTGTSVTATGAMTAGDDIRLTATTGALSTGALTTTGLGTDSEADGFNIVLSAATTITTGPVNGIQNTSLTADEIVLTNSLSARGDLTLRATGTNGISAPGAVTLTANSDGTGGGNLTLDSAGAITGSSLDLVAGQLVGTVLTGGSDVRIRLANAADPINLRDVTAARLGSVTLINPGPPAVYGTTQAALTTSGAQTFRDIVLTGSDLALSAGGALTLRNATTPAGFSIDLGGNTVAVTGALTSGRDIVATSTALLDVATATAAGDIRASSGRFTIGSATAGDDIVLTATAGASTATTLVATGAGIDSEAGNDATATLGIANLARSNIAVSSAGSVVISAATATANPNPATNTSRDVRVAATGDATLTAGAARRNLVVTAGGAATLTGGTAGNDVTLSAGTATLLGASAVTAGRDLTASGASVLATGTLTAGDDIVLSGGAGGVTVANLVATGAGSDSEAGNDATATLGQTGLAAANIVLIASGDVSATAGVSNSGAASRDTRLTSTGGNATLDQTSGVTARDIVVRAANNAFEHGDAGRDIIVAAETDAVGNGAATLDLATAGRDVVLTGASVAVPRQSSATRNFAFTATNGATINGASAVTGDVTGSAATIVVAAAGAQAPGVLNAGDDIVLVAGSGGLTALRLTAGGGIDSEGGSDVAATLGEANLAGSNIVVRSAGAIAAARGGPGSGSLRDLRLTSTAGDVALPNGSASRDIVMSGATAATLTLGSAGRDIVVAAGTLATLDGVTGSGRDTTVSGATVVTTATQTAGDDIRLTATGSVTAANLSATGLGGDSEIDDLAGRLGSNIQVNAGTTATLAATVGSARNYRVQAQDIVLGATGAVTQSAGGAIDLAATRQIVGTGSLELRANANASLDAAAEPLILRAGTTAPAAGTRSIDFGSATLLAGGSNRQSDIFVILGGGANGVALGTVDARGVVGGIADASTFGVSTSANGLLTVAGPVDIGALTTVEGTNLTATGAGGAITIGSATVLGRAAGAFATPGLTAAGDVLRLDAAQAISVTTARNFASDTTGGDIVFNAGTGVTLGDTRAARDILVTTAAGSINLATATLDGALRTAVFAGRDLALTAPLIGNAGSLDLIAGRSITATATAGGATVATATTTGFKLLPDLSGFGTVAVSGNGAITVAATGGSATLTSFSAFAAPSLNSGGDVIVTSTTGDATAGTGTASRDIRVTAAGGTATATLIDGTARRDVSLSGGNVAVTTQAVADDDIVLVASAGTATAARLSTNATANDSEAGNDALTTLGEANLALANIVVRAAGAASATTAETVAGSNRRDVRIAGLSASLDTGIAGRDIVATSSGGTATLTAATAGRDIVLTANRGLGTLTAGTAGRDVTLSGPALVIGTAQAGDDIVAVASAGTITAGALTATGLGPDSEGGSAVPATLGQANLDGSNVVVVASGGVIFNGPVTVPGDLRITGTTALLTNGVAGRDIVVTSTAGTATILDGTAGRDIVLTAVGGLGTLTLGTAGRDVTLSGPSLLIGNAQAGDDIVAVANAGTLTATTLTSTGVGPDSETGNEAPATLGQATLARSNIVAAASGATAIDGVVTAARDYRASGASVALGNAGAFDQRAGGRIVVASSDGAVTLLGSGGELLSDSGGAAANAAAGSLTITAATLDAVARPADISSANVALRAQTLAGTQAQALQPFVAVASAAAGGGTVTLPSVRGGAVTISAPVAINVPVVTASGDVLLTGVAASGNDIATIAPVLVTIDGAGVATNANGQVAADVTISGGRGATASAAVASNGHIGNFALLTDGPGGAGTGIARLGTTPTATTAIDVLTVDAQTGQVIVDDAAAAAINLFGRRAGSSVTVNGTLTASGQVTAAGPVVTVNTARSSGGDVRVLATGDASLATGSAAGNLVVSAGGVATLGDGSAGRQLSVQGGTVVVTTQARAGDDVLLLGTTAASDIDTTTALLEATGGIDVQAGNDDVAAAGQTTTLVAGAGYGLGQQVIGVGGTTLVSPLSGNAIRQLGGSNITVSGRDVALGTVGAARDLRVEAGRDATLGTSTIAGRDLIVGAGLTQAGTLTAASSITAGDDLILANARGDIVAGAATLVATGASTDSEAGSDASAARRADFVTATPSLLGDPTGTGSITRLGGANIVVAASGDATVGSATTQASARDVRVAANGAATVTTATAQRDLFILGAGATTTGAIIAGDDIAIVARGGNVSVATATTTGVAASDETLITDTLRDLSGNALGLPGEAALTRLDGASILVAATGTATLPGTIASAGRYTVAGRSGVVLGAPGTVTQSAARDVLIAGSLLAAAPAAIDLIGDLTLTANSDGLGAGDGLAFALANGAVNGSAAVVTVGRSAGETLGDQGRATTMALVPDGVTSVALLRVDAPFADLRALNDVTVADAIFDGGFTLASKAGQVSLGSATVSNLVPLATIAERGAIDLRLFGNTGATLGTTVAASDGLLRDVTVTTTTGTATVTRAAARDDIVVASTNGAATAATLIIGGAPSDSERGNAAATLADANGVATRDAYGLTGPDLASLAGSNIVVSGGTAASLDSATTVAGANDVRVQTLGGTATLTDTTTNPARVFVASRTDDATATTATAGEISVLAGGAALLQTGVAGTGIVVAGGTATAADATAGTSIAVTGTSAALLTLGSAGTDIIVTATGGDATATTASAARDVFVASTGGVATLTTGTAGRDVTLTGPSIVIDSATAGDDIVAAASAGTLTARTLTATGLGNDNEATDAITAKTATGADIANPALAVATPIAGLAGSNIVAVASGDVTISGNATAARGIQLGSLNGTVSAVLGTATSGDISIIAPTINTPLLTAGGTINARSTVGATTLGVTSAAALVIDAATDAIVLTSATLGGSATIVAGRDILIGSAAAPGATVLTTGTSARLTAGRAVTIFQPVSIGTDLDVTATGGSIDLASFTADGAATLQAATDINVTGLAQTGTIFGATSNAGSIGFGTLDAGTNAALQAQANIAGGASTAGTSLTATATDGAIQLASLSTGNGATLTAGTDVTVTGLAETGTALAGGATTGGDFDATAGSGAISVGQLTAATAATLDARGDATVIGAAAAGGDFAATSTTGNLGFASFDAGGDATLRAAGDIAVTGLAKSGDAFNAVATGGTLTAATLTSGGSATLTSGGVTTITGAATSATAFSATSTGSSITLGSLGAGSAATLRAQTGASVGAATSGGEFDATATTASLDFASLTSGGAATLTAAQAIGVTGAATSANAFIATATGGALAIGSLDAGSAATLRAGGDMRVTGAARSGGAFDARSTGGAVRFGSLDAGAAATLIAATSLRVDALAKATGAASAQAGSTLQLGSLNAASATLTAGTDLTVDGDAATGTTLTATATGGSLAAGSITAGGAATLTAANDLSVTTLARAGGALTARATTGTLRMGSLDALSAMLNAQRDLTIDTSATTRGTTLAATSAAGNIGVGSLDARTDATLTATAGALTLGNAAASAARTGGKLTLAAAGTTAVRGGVAATGDYLITSGGAITLSGDGFTQSGATVTLNAPDLAMTGGAAGVRLASPGTGGRIQLNVRGAPVTRVAIGDNLTASTATSYTLDASEMARISSPKFEIDADNGLASPAARGVDIGRTTIDAGVTEFAVRARGNITLVDTLSFRTATGGAPRTMTLGGSLDGGPLDKTVATNPLANSIQVFTRLALDNATVGTGGQIDAVGSTVGLRATYILLGLRPIAPDVGLPFQDAILPPNGTPLTLETVRSQFFANPTSTFFSAQPFYNRAATPQASVRAANLVLAPAQYALIQNTGASAQVAGGIEVASLRLVKTTTIDPLVGVFGSIDSQNGVVASVRIGADQLDGIVPFNVRINGCIALQSASCILTGVTLPLVTLVDPGNALLLTNNSGLALPLDLVTGASNEVLWRECDEGSDAPGCQAAGAEASAPPADAPPPAAEPARPTGNQ